MTHLERKHDRECRSGARDRGRVSLGSGSVESRRMVNGGRAMVESSRRSKRLMVSPTDPVVERMFSRVLEFG
jgi:hypothetical protein